MEILENSGTMRTIVTTREMPTTQENVIVLITFEFDHAEPEDRDAGIFRAWTAKEALVKGIGVGLDLGDLPLISLPFVATPTVWKPAQFSGRMKVHGQWYVYSLAPSEDYFVSLAAPAEATVTIMDARGLLAGQGI